MTWTAELTLPYPISGNRYIGERVVARPGGKKPFTIHYLTAEAKEYKAECKRIAKAAGVKPILGPVEYEFELYPHLPQDWAKRARRDPVWWDLTVQCLDLDNARKVLLDALNGIAWTDDSRIRKDPGEIMVPDGHARCVLRIKPYERPHPQVSLFDRASLDLFAARTRAPALAEKPF
jgi:crossover junction endodeoxyribonuclease RusA